jgi:hypothetical protein
MGKREILSLHMSRATKFKRIDHLGDTVVEGRIILKWIIESRMVTSGMWVYDSREGAWTVFQTQQLN